MSRRSRKQQRDADADRRRAEFDQAIAEARRDLDDIRPPARPPAAPASDIAVAVAAELDRRQRAEAEAAERAEVDRLACPDGRGCRRCGVSHAGQKQWTPGPSGGYAVSIEPDWERDGDGWRCPGCTQDYFRMVTQTDSDRRIEAIFDRLGGSIPFVAYAHPERFEHVPVWFSEHPDAEPSLRPWAFLDVERLRAEIDAIVAPEVTPPAYTRREPCPDCGVRDKWAQVDMTIGGLDPDLDPVQTVKRWACMACITRQPWATSSTEALR